jgi:hypothetical protein
MLTLAQYRIEWLQVHCSVEKLMSSVGVLEGASILKYWSRRAQMRQGKVQFESMGNVISVHKHV